MTRKGTCLKFLEDDQGRCWEAVGKELMSMMEPRPTLVVSDSLRRGGKVEKQRSESGKEVWQGVKQCGMEEGRTVERPVNINNVRGWVTREATLQAVYNWCVAMKHRKGLVKRQKEKEEGKGGKSLLVYSRRKKDERGNKFRL